MKYAFLLCCTIALAGCTSEPGITTFDQVIGATYMGDESCASCHEQIYLSYQDHGMARSMSDGSDILFPDTTIGTALLRYEVRWDTTSRRIIQREIQQWYDGTERSIADTALYAIGSGSAAHTYLSSDRGVLLQMPITRYTQANKWEFSPGYDFGIGRFDRVIPMRCMNCHNGPTERVGERDGVYRIKQLGIGCENCHGPGSEHVEKQLRGMAPVDQSIDLSIVNPARLTVARQMDVCQQCHLQATESIEHTGTGILYNPAVPLSSHTTYYREQNDNAFEVISHVERLAESACYTESLTTDNILTCTTCHNPHEGFRDKGADYFNATCLSCHGGEVIHEQTLFDDQSCIGCHMQKVSADDAPHASFTDHFIRARQENIVADSPKQGHTTLERYYGNSDSLIYRAYYQRYTTTGEREYLEMAKLAYMDVIDIIESPENIHVGILALMDGQEMGLAREKSRELLSISRKAEHVNTFLQIWQKDLQEGEVTAIYNQMLSRSNNDVRYVNNYVNYLIANDRYDIAESILDPFLKPSTGDHLIFFNRSIIALSKGELTEAREYLELAMQRNPVDEDVRNNLAYVLQQLGQTDYAEIVLRQGLSLIPASELLRANLGAQLTNAGRHREAVDVMSMEPVISSNLAANLALAHLNLGNNEEARRWAMHALTIEPQHRLGLQIRESL